MKNSICLDTKALKYAQSLAQIENNKIISQIEDMIDVLNVTPELFDTLTSKAVPLENKNNIVDRIFEKNMAQNFLKLLIRRNDVECVYDIVQAYKHIVDTSRNVGHVKLTYTIKPTDKEVQGIVEKIKKVHAYEKVEIELEEDKELIAGFVLTVENMQYDYSTKHKFDELKRYLSRR